jgi:hypothetical protein
MGPGTARVIEYQVEVGVRLQNLGILMGAVAHVPAQIISWLRE